MQYKSNIAVFASGSGTNASNLIDYFSNAETAIVSLVLTNKPDAPVIRRATERMTDVTVFDREQLYGSEYINNLLLERGVDFIALAGFLWLVPDNIIASYRGRIVNIHPALLPAYGGRGMYGNHVHRAVLKNGEKESGITIHYVNEKYDEGDIIFQARCEVKSDDTVASLTARIHQLEHRYYPGVVEKVLLGEEPPFKF
ncbi:MAG: phosphoribosylglycinamide formyltransferase [Bacteroidales bacterium]|nr:phosphoribosylglycinamide formyltransferase [Bacteroidales bacterium]